MSDSGLPWICGPGERLPPAPSMWVRLDVPGLVLHVGGALPPDVGAWESCS